MASLVNLKVFGILSILLIHEPVRQNHTLFSLMRTVLIVIAAWVSFILISCNSKKIPDEPVKPPKPKLSSLQYDVFDVSCNAPSCHGSGLKGGLSLIDTNSYEQLVGKLGTTDRKNTPPLFRVKPGSPDSSFLYIKITSPDTTQGETMPKGSDKLTRDKIEAVRQWIISGAPNN
jgi:hypothetical protein